MSEYDDFSAFERNYTAKTPAEYIRDELSLRGEGAELRRQFIGEIGGMYGDTPLGKTLSVYSDAYARYYEYHNRETVIEREEHAHFTHVGALLALHTQMLSPITADECGDRLLLLQTQGVNEVLAGDMTWRSVLAGRMAGMYENYGTLLRRHSDETLDALEEFSAAVFCDHPPRDVVKYGSDPVFGYIFGTYLIDQMRMKLADNQQ